MINREAERYNLPRYVAHQAYYSLANREYESELMPLGLDQGVSAIVWSPLASGRLTGKIRRGLSVPEGSRRGLRPEDGPFVEDERLFTIIEAIDERWQDKIHLYMKPSWYYFLAQTKLVPIANCFPATWRKPCSRKNLEIGAASDCT